MSNIKLSPEHGLNPTIPVCFWCGEDRNEVAILGKIDKQDSEAPMRMVMDYEPCDKCKEFFDKGIQIIGCETTPIADGQFPIMTNEELSYYPTGTTIVVPEDWAKDFLKENEQEDAIDSVMKARRLLMADNLVNQLINDVKAMEAQSQEDSNEDN
jgi:hypothetical protein